MRYIIFVLVAAMSPVATGELLNPRLVKPIVGDGLAQKRSPVKHDLDIVSELIDLKDRLLYMIADDKDMSFEERTENGKEGFIARKTKMICDCDYHPGGCTISAAAPEGKACKCIYKGAWTCGGEVVFCLNRYSNYCKHPDKSVHSCHLGGGDCAGYDTCDCDFSLVGCVISKAPPPNTACKCIFKGALTCGGEITQCKDENSEYCKYPDVTVDTCVQGGGNCDGYKTKCDCDYHQGGCSISKAAPKNTACKCIYKGAWTCGGEVVLCNDFNSPYCTNPDNSIFSCLQGIGDCEGYRSATCDCDYSSGGCKISAVPPANTACHCSYKGFWTCGGDITRCRNPYSYYCKHPDSSEDTCLLGGGDCGGY